MKKIFLILTLALIYSNSSATENKEKISSLEQKYIQCSTDYAFESAECTAASER